MKTSKLLLASAAVMALGVGVSSEAKAFDEVNWSWNKEVTSIENINIDVNDQFDLSGLVEIEKIQMNIGDVHAESIVTDISNTSLRMYDYEVKADLEHEIAKDAVDLPEIESSATAVGNNQSITSTVAVNLHDAQYNMGDIGIGGDDQDPRIVEAPTLETSSLDGSGNTHTDILAIAALGGALDVIQQGEVSALSDVGYILNATVDSDATAVGNNLSVDLAANLEGDAFLVADLTQFNYADVGALSAVHGVSINNYDNLGVIGRPIVSSVATAVGNNVSISVASPTVDAP